MDKSLILNKIKKLKKFKTDGEFAKFLGISNQSLSNWKSRGSYDIELIYTKCENINSEWLITGKGGMLRTDMNHLSIIGAIGILEAIVERAFGQTLTLTDFFAIPYSELSEGDLIQINKKYNRQNPQTKIPEFPYIVGIKSKNETIRIGLVKPPYFNLLIDSTDTDTFLKDYDHLINWQDYPDILVQKPRAHPDARG